VHGHGLGHVVADQPQIGENLDVHRHQHNASVCNAEHFPEPAVDVLPMLHRQHREGGIDSTAGELASAADRRCDKISALPPHALAMAKPLLRAAADSSWDASLATEEFAEPNCFTTGHFQERVRTMLQSRPSR
jgi:enoyl-CoA hydratase/carnithine racemase